MIDATSLDPWLAGLLFVEALRRRASDPGLVTRARPGFVALAEFPQTRRPFDRHPVHFVDAPDLAEATPEAAIWSWWTQDADPAVVLDLTCKVPAEAPASHELFVCTSLRWEGLSVGWGGRTATLPLTRDHVVFQAFCADGETATPPMRVDGSMVLVFAYALDDEGVGPAAPEAFTAPTSAVAVVTMELILGRGTRGVDPWGLALVAPLHPRVTVRATCALDHVAATLVLERPEETMMVGCTADDEATFRSRAAARHDATWVSFAGRDAERAALGWDRLYDRVTFGDSRCDATRPDAPAGERLGASVILRSLDKGKVPEGAQVVPSDAWEVTTPRLRRVEGQGEHDALVLAPALQPDRAVRDDPALRWWRLHDVAPLPLSEHDALHIVWRWPGRRPEVPTPQRVVVEVAAGRVRYEARRDERLESGAREVFFAHGAFFGMALDQQGWNDGLLEGAFAMPPQLSRASDQAWLRHWVGRFCVAGALGPSERLNVLDSPEPRGDRSVGTR